MPQSYARSQRVFKKISGKMNEDTFKKKLEPKSIEKQPLPKQIPRRNDFSIDGLKARQKFLENLGYSLNAVKGEKDAIKPEELRGNIEDLIGFCQIPVGIIGPLRINGLYANGDFFVPLATTEGSLVASYNRGAHVISLTGGASVMCLTESVSRAPCFVFNNLVEAGLFLSWALTKMDYFNEVAKTTTRHGQLVDIKTTLNGPSCYLTFEYTTGDASGQNMVTIATEAICKKIIEESPIKPRTWYLEGNLSGDKRASMLSFLGVRGKKVVAEALLSKKIVEKFLHTSPQSMEKFYRVSTLGGIQSGAIGMQGHFANALTALFIACGQDVACVAEASIGITDMYVTEEEELHVSVSLPNLTVGTIGGGTHLPTARECLNILDCYGKDRAQKFAEICTVTALAGEISIIASLTAGDFGRAHATFRHKI